MKIYTGPVALNSEVPELDVWEYLLGNTSREIPDNKDLIVDATTGNKYTYGEARRAALQLAHGLRTTAGLKTGDVVCVFSPNSIV